MYSVHLLLSQIFKINFSTFFIKGKETLQMEIIQGYVDIVDIQSIAVASSYFPATLKNVVRHRDFNNKLV